VHVVCVSNPPEIQPVRVQLDPISARTS
jgi:hypothetical protein